MNIPLFFFLLFGLGALCVWIGKKASRATTNEDYYLGGRSIGLFPLAMTLLATQLGGGALMGAADEAYTRGWLVFFYPLGMVLGLLILGLGFGARMRKLNLTTVAQLFETIYRSPRLRQMASILSILSLFFILIAQGIAARKFFCSLGFDGGLLYSLFWLVLVFYTVMGGLKAVVNTDILQASFILGSFLLTFLWTMTQKTAFIEPSSLVSLSQTSDVPWLSWLILPLLFMLIGQDMGQRCFAAKKPRTISIASCSAALLLLVACLCPIYFGALAGRAGIAIPEGASVLMTAVKTFTNPTISTFLVCAILMAIISTADSLLCSISSNLSSDFPLLNKQPVKVSRTITAIVGVLTLGLSFLFDNVVSLIMFSYDLTVSILFVPILLGVLLKKPSKRSAIVSMACGLAGFVLFRSFEYKELLTISLATKGFFTSEGLAFFLKGSREKSLTKN